MQKIILKAENYLKKQDKAMRSLIKKYRNCELNPHKDYFTALCSSVMSQQLSTKSAASIKRKFYTNFSDSLPVPHLLLSLEDEHFRDSGVSSQKMGYLREIATYFVNNHKTIREFDKLSDEEIINNLVKIKGVGVWTAQMFLMFTLCRIDVFPKDDLGIKNAMVKHYNLPATVKSKDLEAFADKWKPYRTVASWYLWRSLEND